MAVAGEPPVGEEFRNADKHLNLLRIRASLVQIINLHVHQCFRLLLLLLEASGAHALHDIIKDGSPSAADSRAYEAELLLRVAWR